MDRSCNEETRIAVDRSELARTDKAAQGVIVCRTCSTSISAAFCSTFRPSCLAIAIILRRGRKGGVGIEIRGVRRGPRRGDRKGRGRM